MESLRENHKKFIKKINKLKFKSRNLKIRNIMYY